MPHILLLGAGFSRNWGGWLADEAFEYLLGCPRVSNELLWRYKGKGGFEAAMDELQIESGKAGRSIAVLNEVTDFDAAIRQMFRDMNEGFARIEDNVRNFLTDFDAIFTLNQDLLMERYYLIANFPFASHPKGWSGWQIPGMQPIPGSVALNEIKEWSPMAPPFAVEPNRQPVFKLHGSSNWIDRSGGNPMLIIGGDKLAAIGRHEILKWNHEQLKAYLSKPNTRLMVIGYSFGDGHINVAIRDAAEKGTLKLFIIDPWGVDVLTKNRLAPPGYLFEKLQPHLVGASRRPLRGIFGGGMGSEDLVEHGKVRRFFARRRRDSPWAIRSARFTASVTRPAATKNRPRLSDVGEARLNLIKNLQA